EVTINVYYSDQNGEYLIGEARILSGSSKYVDAISEMMKEPIDSSLVKLIPESTKINSVTVKDGMANVDLSKNFVDDRFVSDTMDNLLIYSIVNTLTEFPDVNSVEFYIDGTRLSVLGMLDLQEPYFRKSDLIKNG
ncbi:MAG: GerMN domain-containing protein, partial [Actinobacteria bacterium]|nr:GerMN domain-containing protein [Actinomycetota bacterium]